MINSLIYFVSNHTPLLYLTQSIWRDEGFSYFMAKPNIIQILINSINDFNPPLYYMTLHVWMRIFGETDIALRMLSFVFHILTVYLVFLLAKKIFSEKFALWLAAFTFFNPMLLYYGFELRMYSMYPFFTLASLYFFMEKRWKPYLLVTTLGIYTHSFFVFVILSEALYLYLTKQLNKKNLIHVFKPVLFFLPWLPFIIWQFGQAQHTWIFPVDLQLSKSALGNLFTGYEGTPGGLWKNTAILSLVILMFMLNGLRRFKRSALLFNCLILFPLFVVIVYSLIRQPIYVNRYVIFITIGEILAIAYGIWSIKSKTMRITAMMLWLALVIFLDFTSALDFHKKTDVRSTIMEIAKLAKPQDAVYAQTPLVYFESAFYYPRKDRVFIYNPQNIAVPKYIGTAVIPKNKSAMDFPESPARTFLVKNDGSYEVVIKSLVTK